MNGNGARAVEAAEGLAPRIDKLTTSLRRHRAWNCVLGLTSALTLVALGIGYEARQDLKAGQVVNCQRINAQPTKIARLLVLSEQLRQLTGTVAPTTTLSPELDPLMRARIDEIRRQIAELTRDLGTPVDC